MTNGVPLVEYWLAKAGLSDEQLQKIDHADRQFEKETRAWRDVCREATNGKITVRGLRHVTRPEHRQWYPEFPEANVAADIPAAFFADADKIAIGPGNPVVLYWTDPKMGGPFNAPWAAPYVIVNGPAKTAPPVADIEAWVKDFVKANPRASREDVELAAKAHFNTPGLRDTVRLYLPRRKRGRRAGS